MRVRSIVASSLAVAASLGATSIAFPAISTGIYGYPVDQAAKVAVGTVLSADPQIATIRFVCFDDANFDAITAALDAHG